MLQRIREWLILVLMALLPFHALLVTMATKLIAGPGHAPLGALALWKEGVLGVVLAVAAGEIVAALRGRRVAGGGRPSVEALQIADGRSPSAIRLDRLDILSLVLLLLSVTVTFFTHGDWRLYLFGFRYDFVPLVAFVILRRVQWSEEFFRYAFKGILWAGVITAGYGVISFFLPVSFFAWLGYSDLHSLYLPDKPIAAFQMIGETALRRVQGPMSGPNHLGVWLLLPIGCAWAWLRENFEFRPSGSKRWKGMAIGVCCLLLSALLLSFSRAAWIGALAMSCIAVFPVLRSFPRRALIGAGLGGLALVAAAAFLFPSVIIRLSSSRGHLEGPIEAVEYMLAQPFGRGMGMAGPASNRVSDACVMLREHDNPSWAADRPDLCVFLGDTQVQPVGRACSCPFLPENWFLQIGVEMGWIGFILYVMLIVRVLQAVRNARGPRPAARSLFLAFIGVSVAALFLHAFEDAAVSYTLWILAAAIVQIFSRARGASA